MFTPQETFEASCLPLIEQGEPARDDVSCRYLVEDGRRCAAGHLMLTAHPEILLFLVGVVGHREVNDLLTRHDLDLVAALQDAHDASAYRLYVGSRPNRITLQEWQTNWLVRVLQVARDFELDPTRVLNAARAKGWTMPEGVS